MHRAGDRSGAALSRVVDLGRFVGQVVRVEALSAVAKVRDMVSSIPTVRSQKGEAVNEEGSLRSAASLAQIRVLLGIDLATVSSHFQAFEFGS